jgi:hypothetical protein
MTLLWALFRRVSSFSTDLADWHGCLDFLFHLPVALVVTRVNSTNVLNEGLRIGEIGHRMNSKVKLVEIGVRRK